MKKKTKRKIDALKELITELTERVESLEKELGLKYEAQWEETELEPLVEGKPIPPWPRLKLVKRHVKPKTVKWERYTKLPTVDEIRRGGNDEQEAAEKDQQVQEATDREGQVSQRADSSQTGCGDIQKTAACPGTGRKSRISTWVVSSDH